jgi:hypothetical protein
MDRRSHALTGFVTACVLAATAFALLGFAAYTSWQDRCPDDQGLSQSGLDKGVSAWPPGAECVVPSSHHLRNEIQMNRHIDDTYVYEAVPALKWVIAVLLVAAGAIVIVGLVGEIRRLRGPRPNSAS